MDTSRIWLPSRMAKGLFATRKVDRLRCFTRSCIVVAIVMAASMIYQVPRSKGEIRSLGTKGSGERTDGTTEQLRATAFKESLQPSVSEKILDSRGHEAYECQPLRGFCSAQIKPGQ